MFTFLSVRHFWATKTSLFLQPSPYIRSWERLRRDHIPGKQSLIPQELASMVGQGELLGERFTTICNNHLIVYCILLHLEWIDGASRVQFKN